MTDKKRLSKVMAAAGIASRRKCEELIFAGRVTVNGTVCMLPQTLVSWGDDTVSVDGIQLAAEENKVYYLLNKPVGYLCSNKTTPSCSKRVVDLFAGDSHRLFTVGRLDKDTSGLLIVTNDGHFGNKVIHPRHNLEKEYIATVNKEITSQHLEVIRGGTKVENTFVKPVEVTPLRKTTVKIVVMEGKKREVRILLENAGLRVIALQRTRIGSLKLNRLKEGQWREMTDFDKRLIFE
ncbi:Uncharacterized RNA pseudouridine synthase aq_1464 [Chlamydiales bacterium SCGC AG-110-P3]|nr:Uncharacterized RNA pseudouridine synthase aq_1464 [Chlamydiales bacterium SCGC AG-110-P3]